MTSLLFKVPNNWFPHILNLCEERTTSLQRTQQPNSSLSSTGIYGTATTTRYYHLNIGSQYMNPGMQYVTAHASCFTASLTAHLLGAASRIGTASSWIGTASSWIGTATSRIGTSTSRIGTLDGPFSVPYLPIFAISFGVYLFPFAWL